MQSLILNKKFPANINLIFDCEKDGGRMKQNWQSEASVSLGDITNHISSTVSLSTH